MKMDVGEVKTVLEPQPERSGEMSGGRKLRLPSVAGASILLPEKKYRKRNKNCQCHRADFLD